MAEHHFPLPPELIHDTVTNLLDPDNTVGAPIDDVPTWDDTTVTRRHSERTATVTEALVGEPGAGDRFAGMNEYSAMNGGRPVTGSGQGWNASTATRAVPSTGTVTLRTGQVTGNAFGGSGPRQGNSIPPTRSRAPNAVAVRGDRVRGGHRVTSTTVSSAILSCCILVT